MSGTAPPSHNCGVGDLRGGEVQRHREPVGQCLQGYAQLDAIRHLRQHAEWNGSLSRLPCVLIVMGFSGIGGDCAGLTRRLPKFFFEVRTTVQ